MTGLPTYPECDKRREPPVVTINQDIARSFGENFRVLPLFEKALYEHKYTKYYSLHTNELLKCRWRSYVQHYEEREIAPFEFINIRDYHFYNCVNRLLPSETFQRRKDYRYKLKVGPGVDFAGQMPIPQDLLMKRGLQTPRTKGKRCPKPKNEDQKVKKDEKGEKK